MTAYVIGDVKIRDHEGYASCASQTPAVVEQFGGRSALRFDETLELRRHAVD